MRGVAATPRLRPPRVGPQSIQESVHFTQCRLCLGLIARRFSIMDLLTLFSLLRIVVDLVSVSPTHNDSRSVVL